MTSLRNIPEGRDTPNRLLDAARESILTVGWRRTTLTDIARRAGMSRMTVYRTYPDTAALFGDLMTREWAPFVAAAAGGDLTSASQFASIVVDTVTALRSDELFQRILDVDPDLLLPYLIERRGRTQEAFIDMLVALISHGQDSGAVRAGDPTTIARTLLLAAHGLLLSSQTMAEDDQEESRLQQEFWHLIERYLAP